MGFAPCLARRFSGKQAIAEDRSHFSVEFVGEFDEAIIFCHLIHKRGRPYKYSGVGHTQIEFVDRAMFFHDLPIRLDGKGWI